MFTGCSGGSDPMTGWSWPDGMAADFSHAAKPGMVLPTAIRDHSGSVSQPNALIQGGACTLNAGVGQANAVSLDYGRVVGGIPALNIESFTGAPVLHMAFSESSAFLDSGGVTLGFSIASEPSRSVAWPIQQVGVLRGRVLQGGQRWQKIWVTGSGSVTISQLGMDAVTIHAPDARAQTGWFRCSDDLLNQIWSIGAYTAELNQMAQGSQPRPWQLGADGADIGPSGLALYQAGSHWNQYTLAFDVKVLAGGIGWVVRASMLTRLSFTLCSADDAEHPNTLLLETGSIFVGGSRVLSRINLPAPIPVGTMLSISTQVGDMDVTVSINGQVVATQSVAAIGFLPPGSFGFFNRSACAAVVSNVAVADGGGASLYQSAFTLADGAALERAFPIGTNPVPLLTDGAKRERQSFSLDLVAAAQTVYYGTGWYACVAGAIRQLCAYVDGNGQIASTLDPAMPLTPVSPDVAPQSRWYSLSYALNVIVALADCWRYSGDRSLVSDLWPAITAHLRWAQTLAGSDGLLVTDSSNGLDWHPQFGGALSGQVSLVNVIYAKCLNDAADMAAALGEHAASSAYAALAAATRAALDKALFNTSTGVYDISDSLRGTVAQDVNALAVLWGVASDARVDTLLDKLESALLTPYGHRAFSSDSGWGSVISPMTGGFEVGALFRAGRAKDALRLVRTGWAMMVNDSTHACGTTWESMTDAGVPGGSDISLAHAWSSGPTALMSRHVLGARPIEAGWTSWLCKPAPGDLSWAAGQVPTPQGPIQIKWARLSGSDVVAELSITVPAGTKCTLALPPELQGSQTLVNERHVEMAEQSDLDTDPAKTGYRYLELSGSGQFLIQTK